MPDQEAAPPVDATSRRVREALRQLCNAAGVQYPGDRFSEVTMLEHVVTPRVRYLSNRVDELEAQRRAIKA